MLAQIDADLVALEPVKTRIREIAALLVIDRLRREQGLACTRPSLHMSFTGNPGTGKTTVALRMAEILHRLGYVEKPKVVSVTRDDLVGQYVGHTAPKTREVLKRARGGVLFIDEAYYLYRPENERDYGQEAIEILLQVMEAERDDLVVVLAGYRDRMETFFRSNPGMGSRVAHHIHFPDFDVRELIAIADLMLDQQGYELTPAAREAFGAYVERRVRRPRFAHGRSIRNAIERARMRQASRLYDRRDALERSDLVTIEAADILASSVFADEDGDLALSEEEQMPRPIILGVVGDSAAGKTTITRGLVRLLGDEHVTHIAADDYHRFDRRQRAERAITPLHPDCNHLDIMEQDLAHVRGGRAILKPVYQHKDGTFGPAVYVEPRQFTVVEGLLGYHTPDPARQLRRPRLPRPARGAAPPVEGAARLLAPRLHERPGPRGARPPRARLGGLHPPPAALGGHRRLLHAGRSRRPGPPRRPGSRCATASATPTSARSSTATARACACSEGEHERHLWIPGDIDAARGRGGRGGDLGSHALRQPPALRAPGRVHHRDRAAPLGVAGDRAAARPLPPGHGARERGAGRRGLARGP